MKMREVIKIFFTATAAILSCSTSYAQEDQRQNNSSKSIPEERIVLHIDQTLHLAGESLWFRIYCLNAFDQRPSDVSRVAYVEILDREQKPVLQAKVKMEAGSGHGRFVLPVTLPTDYYTLRAYTNWMKNFGEPSFFFRRIAVINPFLPPVVTGEGADLMIDLAPEGGTLVSGLRSRVAYSIRDRFGDPVEGEGMVVSLSGDTVTVFSAHASGVGNFQLRPVSDERYTLMFKDAYGKVTTRSIPPAALSGFVMRLVDTVANVLDVFVSCSGKNCDGRLELFATSGSSRRLIATSIVATDGTARFRIDKDLLHEGISVLRLSTPEGEQLATRPVFKKFRQMQIQATPDGSHFKPRDRVTLDLTTSTPDGKGLAASLSCAVFRLDAISRTRLWDTEGLAMFDAHIHERMSDAILDNIVMLQATRLHDGKNGWRFPPERGGHIIRGRADRSSGDEQPESLLVTVRGIDNGFRVVQPDSAGTFFLNFEDLPERAALSFSSPDGLAPSIELIDPFAATAGHRLPQLKVDTAMSRAIEERSMYMQVAHAFSTAQPNHGDSTRHVPFYGHADHRYLLDDYVRFPTMEEVLREFVSEIMVRVKDDKFTLTVQNTRANSKVFFQNAPLMLVDGIPAGDPSEIMDLDPLKVQAIEIVSRRYFLGRLSFDGIINVRSYDGDLSPSSGRTTELAYGGFAEVKEGDSPVYDADSGNGSSRPDVRTVLFWKPEIKTKAGQRAELEFYTSDIVGDYMIVIRGISDDGRPGYWTSLFQVAR